MQRSYAYVLLGLACCCISAAMLYAMWDNRKLKAQAGTSSSVTVQPVYDDAAPTIVQPPTRQKVDPPAPAPTQAPQAPGNSQAVRVWPWAVPTRPLWPDTYVLRPPYVVDYVDFDYPHPYRPWERVRCACPSYWDPVCKNGITYRNRCEAACDWVYDAKPCKRVCWGNKDSKGAKC